MHTLGVFMPAVWTIPENPIRKAMREMRGMGQIVTGIYSMGKNAVVQDILARRKLAQELKRYPVGLSGCTIATCPCQVGLCGLGQTSAVDQLLGSVTSSLGDWKTWALVGGGLLVLVMATGGGGAQRRSELAAAKAQYRAKVAQIRAQRPRRYQKFL